MARPRPPADEVVSRVRREFARDRRPAVITVLSKLWPKDDARTALHHAIIDAAAGKADDVPRIAEALAATEDPSAGFFWEGRRVG